MGGRSSSAADRLQDQIFNLRFLAKQTSRAAARCVAEEKKERLKVKKAIEKGNMEGAKIYAQNAIRKKNEHINFTRLASRLDALVTRVEAQARVHALGLNLSSIVRSLERSLARNDAESLTAVMNQFERQFENLDLQAGVVDDVMAQQASISTPEDEVAALMQQVADEHGLEVQLEMPAVGRAGVGLGAKEAAAAGREEARVGLAAEPAGVGPWVEAGKMAGRPGARAGAGAVGAGAAGNEEDDLMRRLAKLRSSENK